MNFISILRKPTPEQVASEDLATARLELLKAEFAQEYWAGTSNMLRARIERLEAHLKESAK